MTAQRKRRHFTTDYKRGIVAKVKAGLLDINKVLDENGQPIHPSLIETWSYFLKTKEAPIVSGGPQYSFSSMNISLDTILARMAKLQLENEELKKILERKHNSTPGEPYEGRERRKDYLPKVM